MAAALDAHAKPPQGLRDTYKEFQRFNHYNDKSPNIIDSNDIQDNGQVFPSKVNILPEEIQNVFQTFLASADRTGEAGSCLLETSSSTVYESRQVPGLYIYPSLLPPSIQLSLLSRLLFRDLSNPLHQTNVHLHYDVPHPTPDESYFDSTSSSLQFDPRDPEVHKPFSTRQFLSRKLRWVTLGGQYDWTRKVYPEDLPPAFPADIKALVEGLFPMKAEAAIVNLYSPGDTLSLHRDVSEHCAAPLVSVSLGCDGLFICGVEREDGEVGDAVVRLRSGDAVLMSGAARYAWHGLPKVLEGTCPQWLGDWPGGRPDETQGNLVAWKGWMSGKRINLNVRQMFADK